MIILAWTALGLNIPAEILMLSADDAEVFTHRLPTYLLLIPLIP